jgi:cation/acetate symporter
LMTSDSIFGTPEPILPTFLGLEAQGIGLVGTILNFVVAFAVSRVTPPPPEEIQNLVEDIRLPQGSRTGSETAAADGGEVQADGGEARTDGGTDLATAAHDARTDDPSDRGETN